ncbi:MAG: DUF418 domain-containing protein [Sphingorhabdus sp.]
MTSPDLSTRYISLDALRGFAVMGILAMNIAAFDMPFMAYLSPAVYGGDTGTDLASWFLSYIVFDGKMRGLFSLLFGASMMLIIERAEAKGENAARVHYARMFWLALLGLAHFFLIWLGDILFLYACVGCVAFLFRRWQPSRLIKWALIGYTLGFLMFSAVMGGMLYVQQRAGQPNATAEDIKRYSEIINNDDFTSVGVKKNIALYRSGYADIVSHKIREERSEPIGAVLQSFLETLPLMMIGMALLKNGFLLGQWDRQRYKKWALWGVIGGGLFSALAAGVQYASGFDIIIVLNTQIAWMILPRLLMTIGYAALLILIVQRFAATGFIARVMATGQAAFTNYLGTSIIMTTIFYGYGLGLYGHVGRAELWFFVFGAWAVMLLWSMPWLEHFLYGPLEWLWRSLARMKLQPMRRSRSAKAIAINSH